MKNLYTRLKPAGTVIGGIFLYTRTSAMALSLDVIKSVMIKDFKTFTNKGGYYNEDDDPLSGNLINLENNEWRNLRQKLTSSFTSGKIRMMFDQITEKAEKLAKTIEKESSETGQVEVKGVLSRYTTDVIGSTAFGIECNALDDENSKFYQLSFKAFKTFKFSKRIFLQAHRYIARKLHIKSTSEETSEFYFHVFEKTLSYRDQNPHVQRNDFMNLLINLWRSGLISYNRVVAQSVSSMLLLLMERNENCFMHFPLQSFFFLAGNHV
jgi:cytochrome P450 family 6